MRGFRLSVYCWVWMGLFWSGVLVAAPTFEAFVAEQETFIEQALDKEPMAAKRPMKEYLLRQDYGRRLEQSIAQSVQQGRGGKLTSEKLETLRQQRKALLEQLQQLDNVIEKACYDTPEVQAQQAVLEQNQKRIEVLHEALWPAPIPSTTESMHKQ